MNKISSSILLCFFVLILSGTVASSCSCSPKMNVTPVKDFDAKRYLGRWYEIARYDFMWEKNMNNVTADYFMNDDGSIKVVNSGYDYKAGKNKQTAGNAKFIYADDIGALKVSFFGPFYSLYTVIAVDDDYQYALVAGKNSRLLWILSRTPEIPDSVKNDFLSIATASGYNPENLVWTDQNVPETVSTSSDIISFE